MRPWRLAEVRRLGAGLLLWLLAVGGSARAERMVFAHYMVTNQDYLGDDGHNEEAKIGAYEREIQQAQAAGIDGFALNVGGWLQQTYYIRYTAQIFEAAVRLHSGFKLMFSADMCCGNSATDVEDMMRRFANNPRYAPVYFRYKGRFVLTTFAGDKLGTEGWKQIRSDLGSGADPSTTTQPEALGFVRGAPSNRGMNIFLVPAFFWGGETPRREAIEQGFDTWRRVIDGSFYWGIAGVPGSKGPLDITMSSDDYAAVVHAKRALYMAPVCLQFWGANANRYYEYSGFAGMRAMWMDAIERSHPEWVEIITWNDFIEGTYVSPIDDPNRYPNANFLDTTGVPRGTLGYFHSHAGATALLPFFIRWYKTGTEPRIEKDEVFYTYRTQPKGFDAGMPPVGHRYGPVADVVYVTANLTAPATLEVDAGGKRTILRLVAGSSDSEAPFEAGGVPRFRLLRDGRVVAEGTGADPIEARPRFNDYYYSTGELRAK